MRIELTGLIIRLDIEDIHDSRKNQPLSKINWSDIKLSSLSVNDYADADLIIIVNGDQCKILKDRYSQLNK